MKYKESYAETSKVDNCQSKVIRGSVLRNAVGLDDEVVFVGRFFNIMLEVDIITAHRPGHRPF